MSDRIGVYPAIAGIIFRAGLDAKVRALSDGRVALGKHFWTCERCGSLRENRLNIKNETTGRRPEGVDIDKCLASAELVGAMNGTGGPGPSNL